MRTVNAIQTGTSRSIHGPSGATESIRAAGRVLAPDRGRKPGEHNKYGKRDKNLSLSQPINVDILKQIKHLFS
jgi:hypothetical protein